MKNISISTLVFGDFKKARNFCLDVISEVYGYEHYPDWAYDLDLLGKNQDVYASRKKGVFLAAKSNNSIVGTIGLRSLATSDELSSQLRVRYKNPSEIGLVNRLCVTSNLRGQGIGKNLFKNVVDKAKGYGYPILYLNASTTPNSVSFWEKMGFKKFFEENDRYRTTHMELQI